MAEKRKRKRKKRYFSKLMQKKLMGIFALVLFVLLVLNLRIVYITAKNGDSYAKQVLSQKQYDSKTIPYKRGEIQDRNGNVLAKSEKVYNLILDCKVVNSGSEIDLDYVEPTVDALVKTMGIEETKLRSLITQDETKDSQYQVLKKRVTLEQKKAFEEYTEINEDEEYTKKDLERRQCVKGVWFEDVYIRKYPLKTLASNVIGFANDLGDGICGLESYYTDVLSGTDGRSFGYLDENSDLQRTIVEPKNGNTIVTTIDMNIQQVVEKYIAEFDAQYSQGNADANGKGAKNVGVIVANPQNGEIYAMASNHGFDLTDPTDLSDSYTEAELRDMTEEEHSEALNEKWYNYCISESFEPGSTFKPVTISAALETGAVTEKDNFVCDGGEFVTDTLIKCDNVNGHGQETLSDVLKNSCNDGLMQIGMKMGITTFLKYQKLFNFGSPTGIDLPNESSGVLYDRDSMHEVELATNTFGQTFTCTMIQELAAFCTVVNGGYYYKPHVVKQILDSNGGVVKNMDSVLLRQPISEKTSQIVLEALEKGVSEGTGKKARVPGYRVAGKTGTAEKINPETGQRWEGKYLVSFIGCAPADDPQVVVYVVIDEPNVADQSTGGYSMVISRKIMMEILPYLNINMTEEITDELLMELELTWDDVQGGRNAVLKKEKEQVQSEAVENGTLETDAYGNPIGGTTETDSYGNPTDSTAETDIYGNPIDSTAETDIYGNPISSTSETDIYGNPISTVETDAYSNPVNEQGGVSNPNVPAPPEDNGENTVGTGQNSVTNEQLGIEGYDESQW